MSVCPIKESKVEISYYHILFEINLPKINKRGGPNKLPKGGGEKN